MTKALITGGAGFIGSHLAEVLLQRGWTVTVLDDLSTGSIKNVAHLKTHAAFSYVLDSVMNRPLMLELIDQAEVIFHLAAAVGVRLIVEEPVRTIETNIKATELVLELCARNRKPVLLTSTSEVYGKLEKPKFGEEDDVVLGPTSRARWCYAASKIIDEFWRKRTSRRSSSPPWSCACSTRLGRGRRGSTAWWRRASSSRRSWASRSPSMAMGRNGARSPGWAMSSTP